MFAHIIKWWGEHFIKNENIAILIFDLDNFKEYNDQYGHINGDRVLKIQAQLLKDSFSHSNDIISRYGGDEFVVITKNQDKNEIQAKADQIIENWQQKNISIDLSDKKLKLSCSIGIYFAKPLNENATEKFFDMADKALYQAKNKGKACATIIE